MEEKTRNDYLNEDSKQTKGNKSKLNDGLYGPEALKGLKSEIMAGSVLVPKTDEDRAWNEANKRAARIVSHYIEGKGLFQL